MGSAGVLVLSVGVCLAVGFTGAVLFPPGAWYTALVKPAWTPPRWLFGPAWTVLYVLMGVAAWLVWRSAGFAGARPALAAFAVQLALNGLWSWLFFGLHRPGVAFVEIVALWLAIALTALLFARHSAPAAWLLAPYLAWVGYAAALTFWIWRHNP